MKMILVKYSRDCGRNGTIESTEVITDDQMKYLEFAIEKEQDIYFGEVLGKHSEVVCPIRPQDLTILSEDQDRIDWLVKIAGMHIGGNVHLMGTVMGTLEERYDLTTMIPYED